MKGGRTRDWLAVLMGLARIGIGRMIGNRRLERIGMLNGRSSGPSHVG
jgi:hypothetical protein